jgi:hypothetical protein
MRKPCWVITALFLAGACSDGTTAPVTSTTGLHPVLPTLPGLVQLPVTPRAPDLGGFAYLSGGDVVFSGATAPGKATFTEAVVADPDTLEIVDVGTGAYDIVVSDVAYASDAAESFAAVIPDDAGASYLVIGDVTFTSGVSGDVATVVYVIVPAADFAPGASVELDGYDRVALFATGAADAEAPEVYAAAVTGKVVFGDGDLATGSTISASLEADFGPLAWATDPGDPGDPGDPIAITPGPYTLALTGESDVYCDGDLAGLEADFAGVLAADLGFAGGAVDLGVDAGAVTLEGDALLGAFGAATVSLAPFSDTPDVYLAWNDGVSGVGPAATTLSGLAMILDATAIEGGVIPIYDYAIYESETGGMCQIAYLATLTP